MSTLTRLVLVVFLGVAGSPWPAPAQEGAAAAAKPGVVSGHAGSLADMLARLPDLPLERDGAMVVYADYAAQAAALGAPRAPGASDTDREDAWYRAAQMLELPATASYWAYPEWREAFGFDLFQVDQVADYVAESHGIMVLRGTFEPEELRDAWARGGYQSIELGPGEAFAVREDNAIDFADPGGRMAMAHLNVVAIAEDGTLVCSSTRDGVRRALAAISGQGPMFAARPDIAPLLQGASAGLVSALLVHGGMLWADPNPIDAELSMSEETRAALAGEIAAEQRAARRLPPVTSALLGQTAGLMPGYVSVASPSAVAASPSASIVVVLALKEADDTERAAAVIADRLATQRVPALLGGPLVDQPWADLYPERRVDPVSDSAAVEIELVPDAETPPRLLQEMLFRRAPGFLAWQWRS